jgi:hypothetical protein
MNHPTVPCKTQSATRARSCATPRPDTGAARAEERSLVPLGEARLGHIGLDEWLRRSQARAYPASA